MKCDMGGCGRAPTWRVSPEVCTPDFAHYTSITEGSPACNEHLAEACYFIQQFSVSKNLVVKPFSAQ